MQTSENQDIEGPLFGYDGAARYLDISVRQVHVFEERGLLEFFRVGRRRKLTTKASLDSLFRQMRERYLAELEGGGA